MTQEKDLCPINDSGNHRYFIFKVVEVFEPIDWSKTQGGLIGVIPDNLYEKVEYAISGCNCGSAIKQRVQQQ